MIFHCIHFHFPPLSECVCGDGGGGGNFSKDWLARLLLLPDLVRDAQLCQVLEHVGLARLEDLRCLINEYATILVGPSAYVTSARMLLIRLVKLLSVPNHL